MKKFLSMFVSALLMFSLLTMSASAANVTLEEGNLSEQATNSIEYKGLWYEKDYNLLEFKSQAVQPDKNAILNVWMENDNDVHLYVYKTNIFGGYTKVYDKVLPAGVTDVEVENDCNGKKYLVKIGSTFGAKVSIYVYQHG